MPVIQSVIWLCIDYSVLGIRCVVIYIFWNLWYQACCRIIVISKFIKISTLGGNNYVILNDENDNQLSVCCKHFLLGPVIYRDAEGNRDLYCSMPASLFRISLTTIVWKDWFCVFERKQIASKIICLVV